VTQVGASPSVDAVVVGSGINSLACAALLARAGWEVRVLERNDYLGGAIKTAEITEPGYRHDVFSAWHPLWVGGAAHAELGDDLAARGLEYLNTELPTGTLFPDGESSFAAQRT
jgi:phytoene dehydrogenase-like protein